MQRIQRTQRNNRHRFYFCILAVSSRLRQLRCVRCVHSLRALRGRNQASAFAVGGAYSLKQRSSLVHAMFRNFSEWRIILNSCH